MEGNGTWRAKVVMVVLRFCRVPFHKAARGAGLCIGWSEQCGAARGGGGGNPARVGKHGKRTWKATQTGHGWNGL